MTDSQVQGVAPILGSVLRRVRKPLHFYFWYYDFDRNKWFRLKWRRAWRAEEDRQHLN